MSNIPLVSIVVPVWNGERFLERTLRSVREQTLQSWELLIIDDASQDRSVEIAKGFVAGEPRMRLLVQPNSGVVPTRNRGYAESYPGSSFLAFLDHDDCWEADALETLVQTLQAHTEAPAAYGLSRRIDADDKVWTLRIEDAYGYHRLGIRNGRMQPIPHDALTTFDVLAVWTCFLTPGQMLLRRSALERAREPSGLFDASAKGSDEWELAMRLSLQGGIVRVPKFVINKRQHDANAFDRPGYMHGASSIRGKLASSPVYASHRDVAREANRLAILMQLGWVKPSIRQLKLKLALGQTGRAMKEAWRLLRLYGVRAFIPPSAKPKGGLRLLG